MGEEVAESWLELHCRTLSGATAGLVVLDRPAMASAPALAAWPKAQPEPSELVGVARAALAEGRVVARAGEQRPGHSGGSFEVAAPFGAPGRHRGAVAVRVEHAGADHDVHAEAAIRHLQSGLVWLERLLREAAAKDRLRTALEVVATALEHDRLDAIARDVASDLAARLGCERVGIGIERHEQMRLEALSNSAEFDPRSSLARDLEAAMDEAADQDAPVCHPAPTGAPPRVTLAHRTLLQTHGMAAACTIPVGRHGRVIGAITCEYSDAGRLDADTVELCEDLGSLLGPIFELARLARRSWLEGARDWLGLRLAELRGPGHPQTKLAAIGLAVALLLLAFSNAEYRVTAAATLEGQVQRAIVAGIDGYISEANVRAGALIEEGQVLGRLDDRDLLLEQRSWEGKHAQLLKEYRKALAQHDRSQVNFLNAKIDQASAELELLAAQLERTLLVAPFDGIVVKGDLSQSLGSPVERGDLLFEVAPLDGYRIILEVDQRDIAAPAVGQSGQLALTALPGRTLPLTVERITPVSIAEDGRNYFRVEAKLDGPVPGLRPGMEGVAKIETGRRRLIWIWTHGLTDWLRLRAWSWLP